MSRKALFLARLARWRQLTDHEAEADRRVALGPVEIDGVRHVPTRSRHTPYVAFPPQPERPPVSVSRGQAERARREREASAKRRLDNGEARRLIRSLRRSTYGKAAARAESDFDNLKRLRGTSFGL